MLYKLFKNKLNRNTEKGGNTMPKQESKKTPAKKTTKKARLKDEAIRQLASHAMNKGVRFEVEGKAWTAENDRERKGGKLTMTQAQIIKAIEAVSNA